MDKEIHWVCNECGSKYGKKEKSPISTFHWGTCNICKKLDAVTEIRDFGGLNRRKYLLKEVAKVVNKVEPLQNGEKDWKETKRKELIDYFLMNAYVPPNDESELDKYKWLSISEVDNMLSQSKKEGIEEGWGKGMRLIHLRVAKEDELGQENLLYSFTEDDEKELKTLEKELESLTNQKKDI